jgi:hypothetical protein
MPYRRCYQHADHYQLVCQVDTVRTPKPLQADK